MKDTSLKMAELFGQLTLSRTPEERFLMACDMFTFAQNLVIDSIRNAMPNISERELKKELLIRFYGRDLENDFKEKVIQRLFAEES